VRAHGEIWTATADDRIEAGGPVRVTAVEGLRLRVASAAGGGPTDPSPGFPSA